MKNFLFASLLAAASFMTINGQDHVNVRHASFLTIDAIVFNASASRASYDPHENIVIHYTVTHNSRKVVYSVTREEPEITVEVRRRDVVPSDSLRFTFLSSTSRYGVATL